MCYRVVVRVEFHDEREFRKWLRAIGGEAAARVVTKLEVLRDSGGSAIGMPLVRRIDPDLHELRVSKHRVYFTEAPSAIRVLAVGEKDTQDRDIERARRRR